MEKQTQTAPADEPFSIRAFCSGLFGNNVLIFSPEDDHAKIAAAIRAVDLQQRAGHFTNQRYALFFKPGNYDDIEMNVGFFTQVAGLGLYPTDTKLKAIRCTALWNPDGDKNHGLANFWRSVENIEILEDTLWAVSQASPMRRVKIDQNLYLHENDGYTSGGFLGDSIVKGTADHGSQQQWLTRNSSVKNIKTYGWNQVFMGTEFTQPPAGSWPRTPVTCFDTVPEIQEKPFLMYDEAKGYGIFVPALRRDSRGVSWNTGTVHGQFIPLKDCHVARPDADTAASINAALSAGKHLLLTPGIYALDAPIQVTRPGTVILGLGLATLLSCNGNTCMETDDVPGTIIAGILFDAGPVCSDNLLVVGRSTGPSKTGGPCGSAVTAPDAGTGRRIIAGAGAGTDGCVVSESNDEIENILSEPPAVLSDIYFRVGGAPTPLPAQTKNCLTINRSHVIGDNLWIWRADHTSQVGWDKNTAQNGIIINGRFVTMYALMVEHFLEYQTLWNGDHGRLYMYQSETPYDAPCQDAWMSHDHTVNGYASLKVAEHVRCFEGWCIGVYTYHRDAPVVCHSAVEVPDCENVVLHNTFDLHLNGYVGIDHVVNEAGPAVTEKHRSVQLLCYCNKNFREA